MSITYGGNPDPRRAQGRAPVEREPMPGLPGETPEEKRSRERAKARLRRDQEREEAASERRLRMEIAGTKGKALLAARRRT